VLTTLQLQVAFDRMPSARAAAVTGAVAPYADWLEVGTSLIKAEGMAAIRTVVAAAGSVPVLADVKTADDARTEVDLCHNAGARASTVLAIAPDATVAAAVDRTAEHGMELVVDLLGATGERCGDLLARFGDRQHVVWGGHVGKDAQAAGRLTTGLGALEHAPAGCRLALAGGLQLDDVPALRASGRGVRLIVGSAITTATRPEQVAADFRSAIDGPTTTRRQA
jgi:3-hexulose-6-phosphate synthase